jgi:hypothetical protein
VAPVSPASRHHGPAAPLTGAVRNAATPAGAPTTTLPPVHPKNVSPGPGLFGLNIPAALGDAMLVLGLIVLGVLATAFLFVDSVGLGPRHRRWRRRWIKRLSPMLRAQALSRALLHVRLRLEAIAGWTLSRRRRRA